tara:strand:+ start:24 stop:1226 length:1203 start_codon:yes stop_codon:yes gene_type:complete
MNILFITDNFPPENNAPSFRTFEHCKKWAEMGHKITVITCNPNFPYGKLFEGYSNNIYKIEHIEKIRVVRVWSYMAPNSGFFKRILDYISFAVMASILGLFIKTDKIIATSPQFFTAFAGCFLSFLKRKPWVMEIRDLWPDSIVAVGAIKKNSIIYKILKKIEEFFYRNATKLVVVTDSFKEIIIKEFKIENSKIGVFKNGIIRKKNKSSSSEISKIRDRLKLSNHLVISYIGTIGMAHGLKNILNLIQNFKDKKIKFLFIGEGAYKNFLVQYSRELELKNCFFLDGIEKSKVDNYIQLSDIALVNLKKSDEFLNVIPSKIFENVSNYKPILLGVDGEARALVEKYEVGKYFDQHNFQSFKNSINGLNQMEIKKFKNKCDMMLLDFDRNKIAQDMLNFIS